MSFHRGIQMAAIRAGGEIELCVQSVQTEEVAMRLSSRRTGPVIADLAIAVAALMRRRLIARPGTPSGRACGGRRKFHSTQWTQVPCGASGSSTISAKPAAFAGAPLHFKAGEALHPYSYIAWGSRLQRQTLTAEDERQGTAAGTGELACCATVKRTPANNRSARVIHRAEGRIGNPPFCVAQYTTGPAWPGRNIGYERAGLSLF